MSLTPPLQNSVARQSAYNREELLACARGELFEPGHAKLPLPDLLMFDRISHIDANGGKFGKGEVTAELDVTPDLWFFRCHFQDDPVMPGCLGLDALWQLVGFFITWSGHVGKGRALGVGEVRFFGQILPQHRHVAYRLDIRRLLTGKLRMAIADGSVAVDGKEIYTATHLRVGLFTDTPSF